MHFKNNKPINLFVSSVPVPTYILGPNSTETSTQYANLKDGEICSNLTFLGNRGLYTASSGIKIAYVSGVETVNGTEKRDWHFDGDDMKAVRNSCFTNKTIMGEYRGIDILITSQWPAGIHQDSEKANEKSNGSALLSWLASEIKPRYHFCGLNDVYYERLPYRNLACANTQLQLATRFIAIASIRNAQKLKSVYALNILPVDKMRMLDLIQKTTTETPCPYDSMQLMRDNDANGSGVSGNGQGNVSVFLIDIFFFIRFYVCLQNNSQQYFYDMNSFNQNGGGGHNKRRGGGGGGGDNAKRPRPNFDQEKCWFCLSSASVEKHLVINVGEHFYLALAKGPIDDTHCLILPVTHIQSAQLLTEECIAELNQYKDALRKMFKSISLN